MSSTLHPAFFEHARRLRNLDPALYSDFVKAFEIHVRDVTAKVIRAPATEILTYQGVAQDATYVLHILQEAEKPAP